MKKKNIFPPLLCAALAVTFVSCSDDDPPAPPVPTVVKEWNVALSTKNENNPPAGRTETGTVNLKLLSDNTIAYTIAVTGLAAGDALTMAHIHVGDAITNGGVILDFAPTFSGGNASGTVTNIRTSFIDSLNNSANELYFNVHSTQFGGGLVRGQINKTIEYADYLTMLGANEVPAVTTTATGNALIRLTSDSTVYVKVTVANLEAADAWTAAHFHAAAAGANASVLLGFYSTAADFGTAKVIKTSSAIYLALKNNPMYVNAHTTLSPSGKIRAQLR